VVATMTRGRIARYIAWLFATVLVGAYLWKIWHLALTNANFSWHLRSGGPSANLLAVLPSCGTAMCVLTFARLARASRPAFVAALILTCSLGWLLHPTSCDMPESFLDRPNKTCTCNGATMAYYPQGATTVQRSSIVSVLNSHLFAFYISPRAPMLRARRPS
jgi:hypothetical protein